MEMSFLSNIFSMAAEWIGILLFSFRIPNKNRKCFFIGLSCLLFLILIYFHVIPGLIPTSMYTTENLINQIIRTGINWAAITGFLWLAKGKTFKWSGYLGALYIFIYMVSFNMRQAFLPYMEGTEQQTREWIMFIMLACFQWGLAYYTGHVLDLNNVRSKHFSQWVIIIIPILLELYFKWSLIAPDQRNGVRTFDIVLYTLCATLGLYVLVVLFERNMIFQQKQTEMQIEQIQMQYEMQNAKRALQTNTDIRRLYHDMKNHLLTMESMMNKGEASREYLGSLYMQMEEYERNVNTGSSIADALLAEKMERAKLYDIQFNLCVDLTPFSFMKPVDLITILGNSIDNAIEALVALPEGIERIVFLKTMQYANMVVLQISNRYSGTLSYSEGILKTKKEDPEMHGIGLKSIGKAVSKYGGDVQPRFDNEKGWFRLVIMIPVPASAQD